MNKKISFLKKIDSIIGPASVRIVKAFFKPKKRIPDRIDSILIIRPGGIGDAVLLIPSIKMLKVAFPDAFITVLCEKRNFEIFNLSKEVDKILLYDKPLALYSAIAGSYDMVIDTEQWYRLSAIIAYLTRAPLRIGFATNERKLLLSKGITYSQDRYEMESFFDLVDSYTERKRLKEETFLSIKDSDAKKAETILESFSGKKVVVLFSGGSIPEKRWSVQKFHHLCRLLAMEGYGLVLIGGNADADDCFELATGIEGITNLCGKLPLSESAAILNQASLLISGDSGIMHIAFALGTATLSLFGPGNEKKWAPRGSSHIVIRRNLDCSPCSRFGDTPRCEKNVECMNLIEVEEVYKRAVEMLERK